MVAQRLSLKFFAYAALQYRRDAYKTVRTYKFEQLSEKAQEKVIQWVVEKWSSEEIWECAEAALKLLGVTRYEYRYKTFRLYGGIPDFECNLLHNHVVEVLQDYARKVSKKPKKRVDLRDADQQTGLNGMCYDHSLLEPIYAVYRDKKTNLSLRELCEQICDAAAKMVEDEEQAMYEFEYVLDYCEANKYRFLKDGTLA
jgi:hypothetical protein